MFDWVLYTSLKTIKILLSWRFQIKVNGFFNFFSTTNFRYQYLPEAKAYLQPRSFFAKFFLCAKFTRKQLSWSLILKKLQVFILQF